MFKILSVCFLIGTSVALSAQNINAYEYISVPAKFADKKINTYNLNAILSKSLQAKKYKVVSDNIAEWPMELQQNPCLVAKADILDDSSWLRNKVVLQFKDCNDKIIASSKGDSDAKEFEIGFPDALKKSLTSVAASSPGASKLSAKPQNVQQVATTNTTSTTITTTNNTVQTSSADAFSDGNVNLQKVNISGSQFILVKPNSSQAYATFTETGKQGLYRVVLENKTAAFAYFENGNLVVEVPQKDGTFSQRIMSVK